MDVKVPGTLVNKQREFAVDSASVQAGKSFTGLVKEWNPFGVSVMFALLEGDIGNQATGSVPKRQSQSGYAKLASMKDNLWSNGLLTAEDLPSVVNPDSGYLVSQTSPTVSAQEARIVELMDMLIDTKKPITIKDV